ncbi:MAG TPA: 16S rRNA (cytosine(967)-C(5))-methyltransferase RsmB [Candidatus Baltobacteraceae bacterium]|nr:16S rRNA (cytosine(967)-C(5))-methyltransferase RsmB [Candidatus Baltobacteraceae bacterium]
MSEESPREIAVRVLGRRAKTGHFVEQLLDRELARQALSAQDRGLCQELVFGMVRWRSTLDWLVARKTEGRTQNATVRLLLELGLYQLFWLERIPDHAAVHETVELGKRLGFGARAGFLNAILRGYIRQRDQTRAALEELKQSDPALGYSHPPWLVQRWQERWGCEPTLRLLQWNNSPPPVFARLNRLKTDFPGLADRWRKEGIEFDQRTCDWTEPNLVFELRSHPPLADCESFQDGFFYVQDPSTLLAVQQLAPQPGETILDLCAAPGGKTSFIAQKMGNRGRIVAHDTQPGRLKLLEENCHRLGVACVEATGTQDPSIQFDRILIDAPCSNTGVLRRRVDLRWRVQSAEIDRLRKGQAALLAQAAPRLKPGGLLVYSTCSLEPEENEEVVKEFLGAHPQFQLEGQRQLLPFTDQVDGAYVAKLRKR